MTIEETIKHYEQHALEMRESIEYDRKQKYAVNLKPQIDGLMHVENALIALKYLQKEMKDGTIIKYTETDGYSGKVTWRRKKMNKVYRTEEEIKRSTEKMEEFKKLTQPISDWLYKNGTPHDTVLIQQANAELLCGEMGVPFELKD